MPRTAKTEEYERRVSALADGKTSSTEIAQKSGLAPRHVRKILLRLGLPRLAEGARVGQANHQFVSGRRISRAGYALVTAPQDHPTARTRSGRTSKLTAEHRLVLEQKLGRYLLETECVDHIDGLTLHNHPDNLRVFESNAAHLAATLTGKVPLWSDEGRENMFLRHRQPEALQRVDTHQKRLASGAVRLRQILLLALKLGIDSPYLSGTRRHTTIAGIDMSSRSTITRALADLCERWGWAQPQ